MFIVFTHNCNKVNNSDIESYYNLSLHGVCLSLNSSAVYGPTGTIHPTIIYHQFLRVRVRVRTPLARR